jgi:hypothetical protein
LRLTQTLWTEESFLGPHQSHAHRFQGDTLFFHADALPGRPDDPYTGGVWAWRPGWDKARRLASKGYDCYGHASAAVALCIDNTTYEVTTPVEFDLRAGRLDDVAGDMLPVVDHPRFSVADRHHGFRIGFSNDGQYLIYTSAATADAATPRLRIVKMDNLATSTASEILSDVMQWELSLDGTKIFYLTDFDDVVGAGRLTMADFPSGANVQSSPFRTGKYVVVSGAKGEDRGIGFFVEPGGRFLSEYRLIASRNAFTTSELVFRYTNPLEDFQISVDSQYVGYAKADPTQGFNGYIVRSDGTRECILNSERDHPAFEYSFLPSSEVVFWVEEAPDSSDFQDAWFGNPDGCRDRRLFAQHIAFYTSVRNAGLIFGDALDLVTDTFQLKYAAFERGTEWPAHGPVHVQDHVGFPLALLAPATTHLVFPV